MLIFKRNAFATIVTVFCYLASEILSSNILGLFTSQHRSHMLVYQGVIRGLLKKGHKVTVITVLPIDDIKILSENVTVIKLDKVPKARSANGIFRQLAVIVANSKAFNDMRFQKFLNDKNTFDLVLLGYLFNDYQLGVSAHFQCPTVVIWTTQPISFVKRFIGEPNQWILVPQPFVRSQEVGIYGLVYGAFEIILGWILDLLMHKIYREYFPSSKYPNLAYMQNNVSLVLCNHHFSEGIIEAHLPNMIEISGIQIQDQDIGFLPKTLRKFMDSADNGVIYFSLGTVVSAGQLDSIVLNTFFEVLSSIPQKVVWKIEKLVKNSSNIFTSKWLPQNLILRHPKLKLFITHGGKGSTTEALYYAVPMLVIPFFGDQFGNARRLRIKGFGIELEYNNINELRLRQCILEVLNNNSYYQSIRQASKIFKDRPFTAEETATYWIDYVIRHKGALHMQAPPKKYSIVNNIGVFLCFSCFLYAVYVVLKLTFCNVYSTNTFP